MLNLGKYVLAAGLGVLVAIPASAQDLVHEPLSPTFGGNPFNSNHILGIANAQNNTTDPNAVDRNNQSSIFARQLESRLLSALSSQIVDAIFGENPQESGTITFGGQTIEFFRSLDSVTLIIRNDDTGDETRIVIPLFIEVN
ncbi:curli production assembly protein CsgF [Qipengyuania nanhaisediminis]